MRRQILENIQDAIGNEVIDRRSVFINRGIDADANELPVININSISEDVSRFDQNPKTYKRNFQFTIECLVGGDTFQQVHERIEDITEMVEQLIEGDNRLNSIRMETNLNRIEFEYESEGEAPIGNSILYYSVERSEPAETDPDKLRTLRDIHIEWKLTGDTNENQVDALDEISDLNK